MGRQPEIEEPGGQNRPRSGGVEAYRKYWRTTLSLVVKNAKNMDAVLGRKSPASCTWTRYLDARGDSGRPRAGPQRLPIWAEKFGARNQAPSSGAPAANGV